MKRKNLIILLLIAVFVITGCGKKSDNKEAVKEEEKVKEVTYFNDTKTTDKLGFIMSYYDDINVFFGIEDDDIASQFDPEEDYLENDKITIKYVEEDDISFEYGDIDYYISFETGYVSFNDSDVKEEENNETNEEVSEENEETSNEDDEVKPVEEKNEKYSLKSFDSDTVVYQDGGFVVTEYYGRFYVYYIAYIGDHYGSDYAYALKFDYYHSKEEAIEKLNLFKQSFNICSYKDDIDACQDYNGNKVDYKKYRYVKDMIIDYLASNNLYIDSYEKINNFYYGATRIVDKSTLSEDEENVTFDVEVHSYNYNYGDMEPVGKINGCEIYYENSSYSIYMKNKERFNLVTIDLPYGVAYNTENIMKSLKDTFKK